MKKNFTLFFAMLLCLFYIRGNAQTQFWSDTFEDSGAPSSGTRTPSLNQGGPSTPYTYYFIRTDGTNLNLQAPFTGDPYTTYQSIQGSKFWAGEDTDRVRSGSNDPLDKIQNITWTGINISGKTGLTFKGLFAAHRNQAWQNPIFGATYDFLIVEYSIDGGTWTRIGGFNGDTSASNAGYLKEDTNGDNYGDGTELSKTFQEFGWSISGTGTSLSLRFRVSADASAAQEFAIDNFRLFEAPSCVSPTVYNVTGTNSYCIGGSGVAVGLSGSETGVTYQLKDGVTNVGTPVSGTGSAISFGNQTTATTYTVVATRTVGACTSNMNGSAIVTTTALPSTPTATTTAATCSANGTATISNYSASLTYVSTPSGATVGALGAITGTAGTAYTFTATNASNCTSAASASVTIPVQLTAPATPTVTTIPATCSANGTASISNYSAALTYVSTPAGATVGALGLISGTAGTAYTFTATNAATCTSAASASVTIPVQLAAPATPTVTTTPATCSANGTASISNYSAALTYVSTPAGATVGALGLISGTAGTAYTFTATNAATCTSAASASVTIPVQLAAPATPTVTTTPATCSANGTASISNYSAALTYVSTPAGATVGALGLISGTAGTAYTFTATNAATCTSAASASVTIPVQLAVINNGVTLNSGVLTATQLGASYQWYNCSDNSPVGTNSDTFTPTQLGDYKVDITVGSCIETSACITVTTLGTVTFETNSKLLIYPNPSQGVINIKSASNGDFQIVNQLGQIIKTFKVEADVINTVDLQNLSDSVYFIKEINNNKSHKLLIKK